MMRVLVAMLAVGFAAEAQAVAPAHSYDLNGSLADANGGPALALVGGAVLDGSGVTFTPGAGLSLTSAAFADTAAYSIELSFRFDSWVVGSSGNADLDYSRILNADGSDNGLYVHDAGGSTARINYYNSGPHENTAVLSLGEMAQIIFTRDGNGQSVYLNGVSVLDTQAYASSIVTNPLLFFIDERTENGAGFVDYIRTYDVRLGDQDVAALAAVPEPASWAMMVGGFGLAGAVVRRRGRTVATFS